MTFASLNKTRPVRLHRVLDPIIQPAGHTLNQVISDTSWMTVAVLRV
jgi:hypothetical protein